MSFRARIALVSATAVALAVVLASAVSYFVVEGQLRKPIDDGLKHSAGEVLNGHRPFSPIEPEPGGAAGYFQVVRADGSSARPPGRRSSCR